MKKISKRILISLVALAMLFCASCRADRGTPVMTLGDKSVTDHMYEYWMCSYKAVLMSQYSDAKDTAEFWDMKLGEDTTAESFFYDLTYNYIESNLVSMYLFDELGLTLEDEDCEKAEQIVSDLEEAYAGGNRNDFNRLLANYGVNAELLLDIYLEELKSTYVYNHVFENGVLEVSEEDKETFLDDNYVRIKQIYINNKYDRAKSSYDESGNFVMAPLDGEQKAEKDNKLTEAAYELSTGADFDEVYEKYSEDKEYVNGYYLSVSTQNIPRELINSALSLEVGESATVETDYGTHIIKRLEMNGRDYEDEANSDFFKDFSEQVYESVFNDYITSYYDKIEVDKEAISKYTIRNSLPNYSFQY